MSGPSAKEFYGVLGVVTVLFAVMQMSEYTPAWVRSYLWTGVVSAVVATIVGFAAAWLAARLKRSTVVGRSLVYLGAATLLLLLGVALRAPTAEAPLSDPVPKTVGSVPTPEAPTSGAPEVVPTTVSPPVETPPARLSLVDANVEVTLPQNDPDATLLSAAASRLTASWGGSGPDVQVTFTRRPGTNFPTHGAWTFAARMQIEVVGSPRQSCRRDIYATGGTNYSGAILDVSRRNDVADQAHDGLTKFIATQGRSCQ